MDTRLLEQELEEIEKLTEELRSLLKESQRKLKERSKRGFCRYLGVTPLGHVYPLIGSHQCGIMDCPAWEPPITE